MAKTLLRKGFVLDNGDIVRFQSPIAEGDVQGRRIDTTYVEKDEFLRRMSENDDKAREATESAKEAHAYSGSSLRTVDLIDDLLKKAVATAGTDLDTLLAASTVAQEVSKIPSVELIESSAINSIVQIVNANNSLLSKRLEVLVEYIQKLVDNVAFYTEGVFPDVPAELYGMDFEKLFGVTRVTTGGNASAKTAVVGKAVCGCAVCGTI